MGYDIRRSRVSRVVLLAVIGIALQSQPALAQSGELDLTFFGDGWESLSFPPYNEFLSVGHDVEIDAEGRPVFAGATNIGPQVDVKGVVTRLNENGTFDESLSDDGYALIDGLWAGEVAISLAGDVFLAGQLETIGPWDMPTYMGVTRFADDGTLDETFGTGGVARIPLSERGPAVLKDIAVDPRGRVLVVWDQVIAGRGGHAKVARLSPDGGLDTAFASDGTKRIVLTPSGRFDLLLSDVEIDAVGRPVFAGGTGRPVAVRLRRDGSFDRRFGEAGVKVLDFPGYATALEILPSQDLVLASFDGLVKLSANGKVDAGFGREGRRKLGFGEGVQATHDLELDGSGRLVAVGVIDTGTWRQPDRRITLARVSLTGSLDKNYSGNGKSVISLPGGSRMGIVSMAVDHQDRPVLVSYLTTAEGGPRGFLVVRVLG